MHWTSDELILREPIVSGALKAATVRRLWWLCFLVMFDTFSMPRRHGRSFFPIAFPLLMIFTWLDIYSIMHVRCYELKYNLLKWFTLCNWGSTLFLFINDNVLHWSNCCLTSNQSYMRNLNWWESEAATGSPFVSTVWSTMQIHACMTWPSFRR
jgi:hypothetical protein